MRQLNHATGHSGFSTIEVLIAIGVLSVLLAAGVTAFQYNYQNQVEVDSRSVAVDLVKELKQALGNRRYCTANWRHTPFSPTDPNGITPPAVRYFDIDANAPRETVIDSDGFYRGLKVESVKLVPVVAVKADLISAKLVLELSRNKELGPKTLSRSFPVWVRLQGGTIQECSAQIDTNEELKDRACKIAHEGLWGLNEDGECVRQYVPQWFSGTYDRATCPAGYKIDRTDNAWSVCDSTPPAGFTPIVLVNRTFVNFGTMAFGPPHFQAATDGIRTCTCSYLASISNPTAFTCRVSCLPENFRGD